MFCKVRAIGLVLASMLAATQANAAVDCVFKSGWGTGAKSVSCDTSGTHQYLAGGGSWCQGGTVRAARPIGGVIGATRFQGICNSSDTIYTTTVCCNEPQGVSSQTTYGFEFEETSDWINCGSGQVAIGGGAYCKDSTATLMASYPIWYAGQQASGWAATCSHGDMVLYATCATSGSQYYGATIADSTFYGNSGYVQCPPNTIAIASGYYSYVEGCGSYIWSGTMTGVEVECSGNQGQVHAMAICLPL
jgi:hypothetical protein